ncbi:MAG: hypothetical protein ABFS32_03805 [Bacteroidota bacterium]
MGLPPGGPFFMPKNNLVIGPPKEFYGHATTGVYEKKNPEGI